MEIEQFIIGSQSRLLVEKEFLSAMAESPENYIKKPKSIKKAKSMQRNTLPPLKDFSQNVRRELARRTQLFEESGLSRLEATDYAVQSVIIQSKLMQSGAIFGEQSYNFCVDRLTMPKSTLEDLENIALRGFRNLINFKASFSSSLSATEQFLASKSLRPNAARTDVILTSEGPRIIEVNFQWVDGIQALEALKDTFLGYGYKPRPTDLLTRQFKDKESLGILYLSSASGSRTSGERISLEIMAKNLVAKNSFAKVEIIDPEIYRPEYISQFRSLYVNGDPKMLGFGEIPDWLSLIYSKPKSDKLTIFPQWNPSFDKKPLLVEASSLWPDLFCPTYLFDETKDMSSEAETGKWMLKGDGFSTKQVAISGTELFRSLWQDALMFPEDYVSQPQLQSISLPPMWVFDTSCDTPHLIKNPKSKFNVWIIDGKVAGIMASISENEIISDKDFNTIPIPC